MQQTPSDIKAWAETHEKTTLKTMESWSNRAATNISFYGRNMPRTDVGVFNPPIQQGDKTIYVETWSLTGYGSDEGILALAKRHGSVDMLSWLARKCRYAMEWVPKWMRVHGIPPGEDARLPGIAPELSDVPIGKKSRGDTDIKRHWYPRGIFKALIDDEVRGCSEDPWTDAEVEAFADTIYQWILNGVGTNRPNKLEREPRQYLRYASDLETLDVLIDVYEFLGRQEKAREVLFVAQSYVIFAFNMSNITAYEGGWFDFNYGGFQRQSDGSWDRPWIWGWYPYGMQMWYRANCCVALKNLAVRALIKGQRWFYDLVTSRILVMTRWMDPMERQTAPLGSFEGFDFRNSHLGGGFLGTQKNLAYDGQVDTSLQDWRDLQDGERFTRYGGFCSGVGGWKADGRYDDTDVYKPDGGKVGRLQNSGGAKVNVPHVPGLEIANSFDLVDSLVARGLILSKPKLLNYASVIMFHYLGWPHSSDGTVAQGSHANGILEGMNSVGKPARQWHWAMRCGMWWREILFQSASDAQEMDDAPVESAETGR